MEAERSMTAPVLAKPSFSVCHLSFSAVPVNMSLGCLTVLLCAGGHRLCSQSNFVITTTETLKTPRHILPDQLASFNKSGQQMIENELSRIFLIPINYHLPVFLTCSPKRLVVFPDSLAYCLKQKLSKTENLVLVEQQVLW